MRRPPLLGVPSLLALLTLSAAPAWAQCGPVVVAENGLNQADAFAEAFDVDDDWLIVAAPRDNAVAPSGGAAWIYHQQDEQWALHTKLVPTDLGSQALFSHARVAIDYPWAFAGSLWEKAPTPSDRGVVRVYHHEAETDQWSLAQRLFLPGEGPTTSFAGAVEVDDGTLAVSARGSQRLHLYQLDDEQQLWVEQQVLTDPEPELGGDWLGLAIAAEGGDLATAVVRPGVGLVAYRFRGQTGALPSQTYRFIERVDFGPSAVQAGRLALGQYGVAVQGFETATAEASSVFVHREQPDGSVSLEELVAPDGLGAEFGRALAFAGEGEELLFVGSRAFTPGVGPLGLGFVFRRLGGEYLLESDFRPTPGYPQLRFGTGARVDDGRLFVATQDRWEPSNSVSGRVYEFDLLAAPSL
ncbi:MAG: hypothetical protein AAFZ65_01570, partial [Planctomycetota bacterium]